MQYFLKKAMPINVFSEHASNLFVVFKLSKNYRRVRAAWENEDTDQDIKG